MLLKVILHFVHILVSVVLILVVLLQTGKRADLAGAFGGGGSQTAFGARGAATFLSKATAAAAVIFMLTSLGLAILSSSGEVGSGSALDDLPESTSESAPAPALPSESALPTDDLPADDDVSEGDAP